MRTSIGAGTKRAAPVLAGLALVSVMVTPGGAQAAISPAAANDRAPRYVVDAYCGDGTTSVTIVPAAGFDPLSATDDQLTANGLPPRPTNPTDLATWTRFVTGQVHQDSTGCGVQAPTAPDGTARPVVSATGRASGFWGGNVVDSNIYEDAYGSWHVPKAGAPANADARSFSWVGIGSGSSSTNLLLQGGSASDYFAIGGAAYSLWWEWYPGHTSIDVDNLVNYNDLVSVHVHFVPHSGYVTITDQTTGFSHTYTHTSSVMVPDNTAEWIVERPQLGSSGHYWRDYLSKSTTTFTGAKASAPGYANIPLGQLPHTWRTLQTCVSPIVTMSNPGGISADGLSFTETWLAYGHTDDDVNCRG